MGCLTNVFCAIFSEGRSPPYGDQRTIKNICQPSPSSAKSFCHWRPAQLRPSKNTAAIRVTLGHRNNRSGNRRKIISAVANVFCSIFSEGRSHRCRCALLNILPAVAVARIISTVANVFCASLALAVGCWAGCNRARGRGRAAKGQDFLKSRPTLKRPTQAASSIPAMARGREGEGFRHSSEHMG